MTAAIYDRNAKPNTSADSVIDKVRDVVIETAGLIAFSKIQWKNLTDGLISRENIDTK